MISPKVSGLRIVSVEPTEASLVLVGVTVVVRLGFGAWVCEALGFSPFGAWKRKSLGFSPSIDWRLGMRSVGLQAIDGVGARGCKVLGFNVNPLTVG